MHQLARDGADPVPLDFNNPSRPDAVADAPDPDFRSHLQSAAPEPDTESLLAEIGLPAHVARQVAASRSGPRF